ncbi:hypothetical protein, partial [Sphingomonas sp. DC1200-1]|uniref:hypothetical protein n=1 Tax=Sphingomonas sp. DC1200-1 TaxID=2804660 RepID=UPI003CFB0064
QEAWQEGNPGGEDCADGRSALNFRLTRVGGTFGLVHEALRLSSDATVAITMSDEPGRRTGHEFR